MGIPVQKVEFGFTQSSPGVYVYQDITAFVRSVNISRGVSRELDTYQAGTCQIVLDNNARTFDPSYSSSPYNGEIKPQAAVRVTSGNVVIFTGFVDQWLFDYQIVADATASMVCSDAISRLSRAELLDTTWTSEFTNQRIANVLNKPQVAWPSTQRQISLGSITLGADVVSAGTSAWDYIQSVAQSEGGAAFVAGNGDVVFKGQSAALIPTTQTTYRYNLCLNPSTESNITNWSAGSRSTTVAFKGTYSMLAANYTQWDYLPPFPPDSYYGTLYSDSATTWVINQAYTFSVYVYSTVAQNVSLIAGFKKTGGSAAVNAQYQTISVAANTWTRLNVTATPSKSSMTAYLSVAAINATVYTDAVLIEKNAALDSWFDGTLGPANTSNVTYSEGWNGSTNNSASTLTIVTTYSAGIPNAIVLSDADGTAIPYVDVSVAYASETLFNNIVVVSTAGTSTQTSTSGTAAYGVRTYTQDPSLVADLTNGQALANYLLDIYENPQLRFDSVTLAMEGLSADQQTSVLNSELYAAANITYTPSSIGSPITAYERVVGITHSITPDTHHVTFNLAEFGNKFRLDSVTFGILNTSVLGY